MIRITGRSRVGMFAILPAGVLSKLRRHLFRLRAGSMADSIRLREIGRSRYGIFAILPAGVLSIVRRHLFRLRAWAMADSIRGRSRTGILLKKQNERKRILYRSIKSKWNKKKLTRRASRLWSIIRSFKLESFPRFEANSPSGFQKGDSTSCYIKTNYDHL